MKRKVLRRLLLGDLLICSMLLAGAVMVATYNKGSAVEPSATASSSAQVAPITVVLTTDKPAYHRGEQLKFTITAHNPTDKPQVLQFFSGQSFDITVRPVGTTGSQPAPVWIWSHGKLFTMDMPTRTIAPGASYTWTAVWDQTNNNDVMVARGLYEVNAHLATTPTLNAAPVVVKLTD